MAVSRLRLVMEGGVVGMRRRSVGQWPFRLVAAVELIVLSIEDGTFGAVGERIHARWPGAVSIHGHWRRV
jgi:hypothetical protein